MNPAKMTPLVLGFSRATPAGNAVFVALHVVGCRLHKVHHLTFKFLRCKRTLNNTYTLREVGEEKVASAWQHTKEEPLRMSSLPNWILWAG